jgi:hypothetical protein
MSAAVEELLESPSLPEVVDRLQVRLVEGRAGRQRSCAELTDADKAGFISGHVIMHLPATVRLWEARNVEVPGYCIPVRAVFYRQRNLQVLREWVTPPPG